MTTKSDIRTWLERGREESATHMLVVCDTFDYEDYPVYVKPTENIDQVAANYHNVNMQRIMECYCLCMDVETQLGEPRAWYGWVPSQQKQTK